MNRALHVILLATLAVAGLVWLITAHAEPGKMNLKALCDKETCIVKRADLEAVLKSHNGHLNAAKKCAGLNET